MLKRECTTRDRRFELRIGEIGIKRRHLARRQHAFIDQCPARQARDIEKFAAGQAGVANRIFGAAADDVELALERQIVRDDPRCGR